jgi:hypothetical protein
MIILVAKECIPAIGTVRNWNRDELFVGIASCFASFFAVANLQRSNFLQCSFEVHVCFYFELVITGCGERVAKPV